MYSLKYYLNDQEQILEIQSLVLYGKLAIDVASLLEQADNLKRLYIKTKYDKNYEEMQVLQQKLQKEVITKNQNEVGELQLLTNQIIDLKNKIANENIEQKKLELENELKTKETEQIILGMKLVKDTSALDNLEFKTDEETTTKLKGINKQIQSIYYDICKTFLEKKYPGKVEEILNGMPPKGYADLVESIVNQEQNNLSDIANFLFQTRL